MKTATPWRSRIVGVGEESPDQLVANPANWRLHPKAQQNALTGSLDQVGWVQQVLVNRRSGFVIDGHARVGLALSRGEATVPVLYVDLDPEDEALVLATLDPIGAMAEADEAKLHELLAGVAVDEAGLADLLRTTSTPATRSKLLRPAAAAASTRQTSTTASRASPTRSTSTSRRSVGRSSMSPHRLS